MVEELIDFRIDSKYIFGADLFRIIMASSLSELYAKTVFLYRNMQRARLKGIGCYQIVLTQF